MAAASQIDFEWNCSYLTTPGDHFMSRVVRSVWHGDPRNNQWQQPNEGLNLLYYALLISHENSSETRILTIIIPMWLWIKVSLSTLQKNPWKFHAFSPHPKYIQGIPLETSLETLKSTRTLSPDCYLLANGGQYTINIPLFLQSVCFPTFHISSWWRSHFISKAKLLHENSNKTNTSEWNN